MIGGIILTLAVMGGSSIGVVSNLMSVKSPLIFSAWRSALAVIYFFIPSVIELALRKDEIKGRKIMTFKQYIMMLGTSVMYMIWNFGLIFASSRTIQSHTYLINNLHGIFIIFITYITGGKTVCGEYLGALTVIIGCVVILIDPYATKAEHGP